MSFPARNKRKPLTEAEILKEWVCWNQRTGLLRVYWQMASTLVKKNNQKLCKGTKVQGRRHTDVLKTSKSLEEKNRINCQGGREEQLR